MRTVVFVMLLATVALPSGGVQLQPSLAQTAAQSTAKSAGEGASCPSADPLRQPYFGTTHLHTGRSFDAAIRFVPSTPREAYAFAKGAKLPGVGPDGRITRQYTIDRPLDWGLVTDHSEYFGEIGVCQDRHQQGIREGGPDPKKNIPNHYSFDCQLLNGFYWRAGVGIPPSQMRSNASNAFSMLVLPNLGPSSLNTHLPVCVDNQSECRKAELAVWHEMQQAAKEAYEPCRFTSFIGYEMSSTPVGVNWHRNVIFANDSVIERPITNIDLARAENPDPQTDPPLWLVTGETPPGGVDITKLWSGLTEQCLEAGTGCDVLTIPHNSNLGGGLSIKTSGGAVAELVPPMFFDPIGATDEERRESARKAAFFQPLVEIFQDKGSSECRWDPRFGQGVGTNDELCDFEILDTTTLLGTVGVAGSGGAVPPSAFNERAFVRNVFKDGLAIGQELGVNPFKMGVVSASDSHNGTMGWHPEDASFGGHQGIEDAVPVLGSAIQNNSGGPSVVWAEENTRESIFAALKRRETYGTSGPRLRVRFFGGWNYDDEICGRSSSVLAAAGYGGGVPMGGDLAPPVEHDDKPRFLVAAWWDDQIQTPLQQVQIVKGWVDADGTTNEEVIVVAGGPNDASVSESCGLLGDGADYLCGVFEDESFDAERPTFYYARVIENPVCRYSTRYCQETFEINPLSPSCVDDLAALGSSDPPKAQYAANCCNDESSDLYVQPVIQERAWTSPIWWTPALDADAETEESR